MSSTHGAPGRVALAGAAPLKCPGIFFVRSRKWLRRSVRGALKENTNGGLACYLVDALCGRVAEGKHRDKIHMAVVRGENGLALNAEGAQMGYDVGKLHDFVQSVRVALFVEACAVVIADFVQLFRVEKLRERFVFVRGGKMGIDDLVAAGPISGGLHVVSFLPS